MMAKLSKFSYTMYIAYTYKYMIVYISIVVATYIPVLIDVAESDS